MTRRPVQRALVSVHDKTGLAVLAARLVAAGVELVSSGGTARAIAAAGLPVTAVSDVTGAPEILGGRVKTLHPLIHGGVLAALDDPDHTADLDEQGIAPFGLVVCNLYPFEATVSRPGVTDAEAVEQIDIGGPAMIRAAAKNHAYVMVATSPADYDEVAAAVEEGGAGDEMRLRLARKAFARTAAYDAAITRWLVREDPLPESHVVALERVGLLRYGENPHQEAALYAESGGAGWWQRATQLQGKEMSFNNYVDAEAAWRLVNALEPPGAVIVKHTNPCGVAVGDELVLAFGNAWECDPLSAFGGVVALNRPLDASTALALGSGFVEVVVAPSVEEEAAAILAPKKNLRLLAAPPPHGGDLDLRRIEDGFVAQQRDRVVSVGAGGMPEGWKQVAGPEPDGAVLADLGLAWTVAAHTKSNAIVIARDGAAVGVGAGDQSRVGAAERALARAGERAGGAVAASDAFLPFRDGLDTLAAARVVALVQPGGSVRDAEVIEAADEHGMTLVLTGQRHFRH